jgi:hypothetical protein
MTASSYLFARSQDRTKQTTRKTTRSSINSTGWAGRSDFWVSQNIPQPFLRYCSVRGERQPVETKQNRPPRDPRSYAEPGATETRHPVPGTKLGYFGDYELLEEIARGRRRRG